jgi:thioredoxin-like negative regulator of GroEL
MKVLILYRPNSEHASTVESFVRDFQHQHDMGEKVELVSVNTRDGASTAALYDIWEFPTVVALAGDGHMLNMWQGLPLPLMDEVVAYTYS